MTCIAAIAHEGKVWMAGDSYCTVSDIVYVRAEPKVFFRDEPESNRKLLFGCAGDAFIGNMIQYEMQIPTRREDLGVMQYIGVQLGQAIYDGIGKRMKVLRKKYWPEFAILIGYEGKALHVDRNVSIMHEDSGMVVVGWGAEVALGALEATKQLPPEDRLRIALEIAAKRTYKVAPPYDVLCLG